MDKSIKEAINEIEELIIAEFPGSRRAIIEGSTIMAICSKASHAIGLALRCLGGMSTDLSSFCRASLASELPSNYDFKLVGVLG